MLQDQGSSRQGDPWAQAQVQEDSPEGSIACMSASNASGVLSAQSDSTALVLQDQPCSLSKASPASVKVLLMQQQACISFMQGLALLSQPEPHCSLSLTIAASSQIHSGSRQWQANGLHTIPAPVCALATVQSERDEIQGGHPADLQELVTRARAAVTSALAACNASTLQLQSDLEQRDQFIRDLQSQVSQDAFVPERLAIFSVDLG